MSRDLEELSNYFQTVLKDKKAENATLKQQLAIAVEALKEYAEEDNWEDCHAGFLDSPIDYGCYGYYGYQQAQEALLKIKELEDAKR